MDDPYRLERFTQAQDAGGAYQQAVAELRAGRKVSHWMWFVFPQACVVTDADHRSVVDGS